MNEFYHAFKISFNWWFVVAPILVLATGVFGITKYKLDRKSLKILTRGGGDFLLNVVATSLDALIHFLILRESGAGLVQLVANHLGDSDIAWMPIVASMALLGSALTFYIVLFGAGRIGEWARYGYLAKERAKIKKAREAKKAEESFRGMKTAKREVIDLILK